MMKRKAVGRMMRYANRLVVPLVARGAPIGARKAPMALLTVRGRKSGLPRTVPVALAAARGGWTLVSVYGVSDWSRNLEAAGRATVTMRGDTTAVAVERLAPEVAGPILRDAITDAPWLVQRLTSPYFVARPDSPIEDWESEAVAHPVFRLSESLEDPSAVA